MLYILRYYVKLVKKNLMPYIDKALFPKNSLKWKEGLYLHGLFKRNGLLIRLS